MIDEFLGIVPVDTDPLHARVDLNVHRRASAQSFRHSRYGRRLVGRRAGYINVVPYKVLDLARVYRAAHEYGRRDAGPSQIYGLLKVRHAEIVCSRLQELFGHGLDPMPVCVRLHHGHDLHSLSHERAYDLEVVPEPCQGNLGPRRPVLISFNAGCQIVARILILIDDAIPLTCRII